MPMLQNNAHFHRLKRDARAILDKSYNANGLIRARGFPQVLVTNEQNTEFTTIITNLATLRREIFA